MKLSNIQQYSVVTANYWAFTLTDGALRLLVVGHFHELGYTTLQIALLFLFYEFFGIITNLYGGWIGARYGLRLNSFNIKCLGGFTLSRYTFYQIWALSVVNLNCKKKFEILLVWSPLRYKKY